MSLIKIALLAKTENLHLTFLSGKTYQGYHLGLIFSSGIINNVEIYVDDQVPLEKTAVWETFN